MFQRIKDYVSWKLLADMLIGASDLLHFQCFLWESSISAINDSGYAAFAPVVATFKISINFEISCYNKIEMNVLLQFG